METSKLIPAPIDNKNIMEDWIEEVFDGQCAAQNKGQCLGFIKGVPTKCDIVGNTLHWSLILSGKISPNYEEKHAALTELRTRLAAIDKGNEGYGISVRYTTNVAYTINQSFYFIQD